MKKFRHNLIQQDHVKDVGSVDLQTLFRVLAQDTTRDQIIDSMLGLYDDRWFIVCPQLNVQCTFFSKTNTRIVLEEIFEFLGNVTKRTTVSQMQTLFPNIQHQVQIMSWKERDRMEESLSKKQKCKGSFLLQDNEILNNYRQRYSVRCRLPIVYGLQTSWNLMSVNRFQSGCVQSFANVDSYLNACEKHIAEDSTVSKEQRLAQINRDLEFWTFEALQHLCFDDNDDIAHHLKFVDFRDALVATTGLQLIGNADKRDIPLEKLRKLYAHK